MLGQFDLEILGHIVLWVKVDLCRIEILSKPSISAIIKTEFILNDKD